MSISNVSSCSINRTGYVSDREEPRWSNNDDFKRLVSMLGSSFDNGVQPPDDDIELKSFGCESGRWRATP